MAKVSFELTHGLVTGKGTDDETKNLNVELRELSGQDIIDSQLAAERVVIGENGKAVAYVSEVLYGLELLRRQVSQLGILPGPLSLKHLGQLHPEDLELLNQKAESLDELIRGIGQRGRADAAGDGAQ
ncbi:TPA: phage tail assembly protein [Serratia marcescens]|nr:phage tail assembly protein [Serratia marcescens]